MPFAFTPAEVEILNRIPEKDLIDLAVSLDVVPDEVVDRPSLLLTVTERLLAHGRRAGALPFSRYDAEDLAELPPAHRAALAQALGWPAEVPALTQRGEKAHRALGKGHPIALWLPTFLAPLARLAAEGR